MGLFTPDLAFDVVTKDMIVKFKVSEYNVHFTKLYQFDQLG